MSQWTKKTITYINIPFRSELLCSEVFDEFCSKDSDVSSLISLFEGIVSSLLLTPSSSISMFISETNLVDETFVLPHSALQYRQSICYFFLILPVPEWKLSEGTQSPPLLSISLVPGETVFSIVIIFRIIL